MTELSPLPGVRPTDTYNRRSGPPRVMVSARCNVCKAGGAILALVNRLLTTGSNYTEVYKSIQPLARAEGLTISYDSIRNHQQAHLPIEDAAIQQIVQRRTNDLQSDFANGTRQVVTAIEYAEAMMTKGFFQMANPNTVIEPMDALAAANAYQKFMKENETDSNVASLLLQLDTLLRVVKDVVPEEYWVQIADRLSGAQPGALTAHHVQDAVVINDEDDAFDPPEDDDDEYT